jgi:hypothetical protein
MIRSILYATDLGLYAPYVLQHALALTCMAARISRSKIPIVILRH